jgi:hypothetical protein
MKRILLPGLACSLLLASCGGGGGNTSSPTQSSQEAEGKLVIHIPLNKKVNRHIHNETDLVRIYLGGEKCDDNGCNQFNLGEYTLTPENNTLILKIPSGHIWGEIRLIDNETITTDNSTNDTEETQYIEYEIGGTWFDTFIKKGETKELNVFIPTGIWKLSTPINGITRIQVGVFPTETDWWGSKIPKYVVYSNQPYIYPMRIIVENQNGSLSMGYICINCQRFSSITNETGKFSIETDFWEETKEEPKPIIGIFNASNGSEAKVYWFDNLTCTLNATAGNETFNMPLSYWECSEIIPISILNTNQTDFNATYSSNNTKDLCIVKYSDGNNTWYWLGDAWECSYHPNPDNEYYHIDNLTLEFSISGLNKTTVEIKDLPLPWKDMAKIESFNVTCEGDNSNCTYTWKISNPDNHTLECWFEMNDTTTYNVDCKLGNFTCSEDDNCTNAFPVKFIVRDKAFVEPLADVKEVNQ